MKIAIGYARFSPRPDEEKSESLKIQRQAIEEYCTKRGYELKKFFSDSAVSGDDPNREELWKSIEYLKKYSVLVV
jgi:DNA invertase Pin-like site-specific DNA recombinase